jgi:hypothetical protein
LPDDSRGLRVQEQSLSQYLLEHGLWVVGLRAFMEGLDFSLMVRAYSAQGRCELHPRTLLGLIVYGILRRQWTLRELESLAKCEVGAWLMCGGHQPDHSTMGKFIQLHSEVLTKEFFPDLVKQIVRRLRLRAGVAAVDATVIEAASGGFGLLRAEAARARAEAARRAATADPQDTGLAQKPELAAAAVQLIAAQGVHPSSEPALFTELLDEHRAVLGCDPTTVLADAGYATLEIFVDSCKRGLDLLWPRIDSL